MVTSDAARFHELLELRYGLLLGDAAQPAAVFFGDVPGVGAAAPAAAAAASAESRRRRAERAVDKAPARRTALQVARIERRGIDHLERELILLEEPARPAGRHQAAVLVVEPDADGLQLQRVARGRLRHGVHRHAELSRAALQHGRAAAGTAPRWLPVPKILPIGVASFSQYTSQFAFNSRFISDERIVDPVADQVTRRTRRPASPRREAAAAAR